MVPRQVARRLLTAGAAAGLLLAGLSVSASPVVAAVPPVPDATEVASPAATSLSPGRLDVFTRSSGGTLLYQYRPVGGSWTVVRDLGGSLASQPSVVSWAAGRFDVFARGTSGAL
ncbi:MAG TPA: hypothetical protein VLR26_13115, partial [Frankiaceae bacterium]|nr:hypothetical protein [Frankiaceae bacterium]